MQKKELNSSNIKILVCCHKPCELPKDEIFLPIHVGAAISEVELGMQRDDQLFGQPCDNISAKNKSYCELTAMYWAWKNIKKLYPDLEYIGLNHYRRFFSLQKSMVPIRYIKRNTKCVKSFRFDQHKLNKLLKHFNIVLSKKISFPYPLSLGYCLFHETRDYRILRDVVCEKYPNYRTTFTQVMENDNKFSGYNMFIMKWDIFNDYCSWLFDVLFEVENRIDLSAYSNYQMRSLGFMSERLLNVFFHKLEKETCYAEVIMFDNERKKTDFYFIKKYLYDFISLFIKKLGKIPM